ncbi:hypothetical protein D3C78_1077320 [compost metagenome]
MFMILLLIGAVLPLYGCSGLSKQRSAEEWLSLSYSGLAATDQYSFSGSMSIKTAGGLEFNPQIFSGKVVDHKQLTVQSGSEDPLHWNPVQVLGALKNGSRKVSILREDSSADTITLLIEETEASSKKSWEQRLRAQLDQVGANVPQGGGAYRNEWVKELERSRLQLDAMLNTLQAKTAYELTIDRKRLLPLRMDEKSSLTYLQNGRGASESRYTTVRFQSFNGASSDTVQ